MVFVPFVRQADSCSAELGPNARFCRIEFVILTVTPIAGRGGEGDRREPRPGQSGCHRGPGSTFRSSPRAQLPGPGRWGLRPRPAGRARRGHPVPGSRSSPSARAGRRCARRPRASPGRGRTPLRDRPEGRTAGRWPGPARRGRSGGCGPGRWAAAGSGCSERPCGYFSSTLSDTAGQREHAPSRRSGARRRRVMSRLSPLRIGIMRPERTR